MYAALAGVYHLLFPARPAQLDFLAQLAGPPPARVLDVACGTGEYVAALLQRGYDAAGVELDSAMVAAGLARHPQLAGADRGGRGPSRLLQGDMLELFDITRGPCALAYCIGNSLPHLPGDAELADALAQLWDVTRPAGLVALQVVNFDRVQAALAAGGFAMPPMQLQAEDGTAVEFSRGYRLLDSGRILFRTQLRVGEARTLGETPLLVLTRARLEAALPAGAQAQWYGDFDRRAWTADSPASVVVLS